MSITLVNAKLYVARVLAGGSSQETIDAAAEAILRGYSDWEEKKFWMWLRKDTSSATAVTGLTATAASAVVSAISNNLNFVNIGQTVTIAAADTATLAAGTTVSSYTRDSSGNIATITLSNAFGGTTDASATLTFSADIPITIGVNEYNLPLDYNVATVAKFTSNLHRTLIWRDQEYWDRVQPDESLTGMPSEFTTYNPVSEVTQNYGDTRLRFDRIPDATDTMRLRYYRQFNTSATSIDIPDHLLYKFLDYCRALLLEAKRAKDDPGSYRDSVIDAMEQAAEGDNIRNTEDDVNECIKSQFEMGLNGTPLWRNGDFDTYSGN
jgi:hypothetical protein